ncbi:E3 ubiquitin-protein ligase TOM1 Ecym_4111 [Eremothecium cymbalariae DBVPG|uniref:HECT-type E3 ubiquitin transferase n=1 Tax=Eremothecium cymbalariae (strain CBS 270.75 / DBVPG 7215 / KCTC 17166 / NRRL Y-17582) TaxID=931890 RepID=G8JT37_ERECY|nr:hypothetical protein Ecym_4111 [Eremothecium cymbalariae DBVPG\
MVVTLTKLEKLQKAEKSKTFKPLIDELIQCDDSEFFGKLAQITQWDRSKDDLFVWIPVLDRMDGILSGIVNKYKYKSDDWKKNPVRLVEMAKEDEDNVNTLLLFTCRLLNNTSNRSLYSSLDVMSHLLSCPNFRIKLGAMKVVATIGERHVVARHRIESSSVLASQKLKKKCLSLALCLPSSTTDDSSDHFSLVDLFFDKRKYPSKWSSFQYTYYITKKQGTQQSPQKHNQISSMKQFILTNEELKSVTLQQIFDKAMEELPSDFWFEFSLQATIAKAFSDDSAENIQLRNLIIQTKFAAIAFANAIYIPPQVSSKLFEMDPYAFNNLTDFISLSETKLPKDLRTDALFALECISLKHVWCSDIVRNLGGNMSHGLLFQILRYIAKVIREDLEDEVDEEYNVRFFYLISNLADVKTLQESLISAGLISSLLEIISIKNSKYKRTLASAAHLLEDVISDADATAEFINNNGFNILIETVTNEVNFALEHPDFGEPPKYSVVYYSISFRQLGFIRSLLKLVLKLLKTDSGDRIRNLIDSPILLAFNKILENRPVFGFTLVSHALDVVQTIINTEPTIYQVLVESGTVSYIINQFEQFLGPTSALLCMLPEVISAICLNNDGLKQVREKDLLKYLFQVIKTPEFAKILSWEDQAVSYGVALDELARHYPELKPCIENYFVETVKELPSLMNFTHVYLYESTTGAPKFYLSENDEIIDNEKNSDEIAFWEVQESSPIIDCFSGVFYSMASENVTWADLTDKIGFQEFLRVVIPEKPTFDYINSQTLLNFTDVLKMFDDERRSYALPELLKILDSKFMELEEFLSYDFENSYILNECHADVELVLQRLHVLNVILYIMTDMYINITTLFPVRVIQIMEFFEKNGFQLITNLRKLFQRCVLEETYIRSTLPPSVAEETISPSISFVPPIVIHKDTPLKVEARQDKTSAVYKNTLETRHVFQKLQSWISMLFRCFLRLTHARKMNVECYDRALEVRVFDKVVEELIKMLDLNYLDTHMSYFLVILDFNTHVFTCPKASLTMSDGAIQTMPAFLFYQAGGFKIYHTLIKKLSKKLLSFDCIEAIENVDYVKDQDDVITVSVLMNSISFMNRCIQLETMENIRSISEYYPFDDIYYNLTRALIVPVKILALGAITEIFKEGDVFDTERRRIPYSVFKQILNLLKNIYNSTFELEENTEIYELRWDLMPVSHRKVEMLKACGISADIAVGYLEEEKDDLPVHVKPDVFSEDEWKRYIEERKSGKWVMDIQPLPPQYKDISTREQLSNMRTEFYQDGFESGILKILQHYPKLINAISHMFFEMYGELGFPHTSMLEDLQEMMNNISIDDSNRLAPVIHLFGIFLNDKNIYDQAKKEIFKFVSYLSKCLHPEYVNYSWFSKALYVYEIIFAKSETPEVSSLPDNITVSFASIPIVYRIPQREKELIFNSLIRVNEITDFYSALAISRILILYTREEQYAQEVTQSGILSKLLKVIGTNQKFEKINYLESSYLLLARRCFETSEIVSNLIEYELSRAFTTRAIGDHKEKLRDLPGLITEKASVVMRNPDIFVNKISETARFEEFVSPTELENLSVRRYMEEKDEEMSDDSPSAEKGTTPMTGIVHLLLSQLMASHKKDWVGEPPLTAEEENQKSKKKSEEVKVSRNPVCAYMIFLLKVLTELVSSYKQSKFEFLTYNKKNFYNETPKPRATALNFFLYQLLDTNTQDMDKYESKRRDAISGLAKDTIIGFASSVQDKETKKLDPKIVDSDMTYIRRFTIEAISKALKEASVSPKAIDANAGKLFGWFHLTSSLLVVDKGYLFSVLDSNKSANDKYQLCKLMIEMNLPGTITDCMASLDLNYPLTKKLFNSGVEPLNALNEVRNNFSDLFKVENNEDEEVEDVESDKDDVPDMFKNSALGMYDIEDIEDDHDEENESLIGDDGDIAFVDDDDGLQVVFSEEEALHEDSTDVTDTDDSGSEQNISFDGEGHNVTLEVFTGSAADEISEEVSRDIQIVSGTSSQESYYTDGDDSEGLEMYEEEYDSDLDIDMNESELGSSNWESGLSDLSDSDAYSDEDRTNNTGDGFVRWYSDDGVEFEDDSEGEGRRIFTHFFPNEEQLFRVNAGNSLHSNGRHHHRHQGSTPFTTSTITLGASQRRPHSILSNPLGPSGLEEVENDIVSHYLGTFDSGNRMGLNPVPRLPRVLLFDGEFFDDKSSAGILLKSTTARWNDIYEMFYDSKIYANNVVTTIISRIFEPSVAMFQKRQEEERVKQKFSKPDDQRPVEDRKRKRHEVDSDEEHNEESEEVQEEEEEEEGGGRGREGDEEVQAPASQSHEHLEPIYVTIDGEPVNIAGTDMDAEFLNALPEDMRAEVFAQHIREYRAQPSDQENQSREIEPEFLNTIPESLRQEILAQEAPLTRLSRANVLEVAERDPDEFSDFEEEADRNHDDNVESEKKKVERVHFSPLVDRSGIAAIMKAVFIPQPYLAREIYHELFFRLCSSKQNRSDIMNMLLLILTDGINDQHSLEKVYNLLSSRAATAAGPVNKIFPRQLPPDCTPLIVANQCIEILQSMVDADTKLKFFFITEHENLLINKSPLKSKKDIFSKNMKWPINCLLALLDKKIITDEAVLMDLLTRILQVCTKPIASFVKTSKDNNKKKFEVPDIEKKHLDSVVSIVKLDSCNTKVFQQTLNIMTNLFVIEEAHERFTKELSNLAQDTIKVLVNDLDALAKEIPTVQSGTEVNSEIIQKFTVPSSDQSKLLKVLTAIDYIYVNRKKEEDVTVDLLMPLYNKMKLGNIWVSLSNCLTKFEEKHKMSTSATVLLPLIESLMVVSKHSKVRETKEFLKYEAKKCNFAETPVQNLFFAFTDLHKKLLNEMIRSNPKLMSGPFSLLVKNPKILDFDNKRYYFTAQLRSSNHDRPKISISVRREHVFLDSYRSLFFKSNEDIKNSKLEIAFKGEAGVDAGGVTREWYQVLSRQMFNPDYALFLPVASDKTTFRPNRTSGINPEHLSFFKFIGMIIGKAISDQCFLDCHFSREVYKNILGKPVSLKDMESLDLDYYKSLIWILENDITDIIEETFSVEADDYGEHKIIDLIENGSHVAVTEENKHDYVKKIVEYKLQTSVKVQMDNFLQGFYAIIPKELISIFDEQELELLISGLPDIDVDDWRNNTTYVNYTPTCKQINYFWRAVRSFDKEERAKLLQFITGTSKVPLNGFKELSGVNGISKFSIHRDYGSIDRLPSSHTCFNQLDLPAYDLYETLRGSLLLAINEGHVGFGIA